MWAALSGRLQSAGLLQRAGLLQSAGLILRAGTNSVTLILFTRRKTRKVYGRPAVNLNVDGYLKHMIHQPFNVIIVMNTNIYGRPAVNLNVNGDLEHMFPEPFSVINLMNI